METLEELKEKFNKLNKERGILFKRILELEDQETLKKMAFDREAVKKFTDGHEIVKTIVVPNKIVTIVVK